MPMLISGKTIKSALIDSKKEGEATPLLCNQVLGLIAINLKKNNVSNQDSCNIEGMIVDYFITNWMNIDETKSPIQYLNRVIFSKIRHYYRSVNRRKNREEIYLENKTRSTIVSLKSLNIEARGKVKELREARNDVLEQWAMASHRFRTEVMNIEGEMHKIQKLLKEVNCKDKKRKRS